MYKKKTVPIRFSGNSSSNYWNSRKKSLFLHFKQEKLWAYPVDAEREKNPGLDGHGGVSL